MAVSPRPGLTFHRSKRLRANRDFQRTKSDGRRLTHGCLILNWLRLSDGRTSRLGVITGKPVGPAVERNRARRLLRESYRLHQYELSSPVDLVLVARRSITGKKFHDVEKDFLGAARRAGLLKERS